jgi:hypothetical protein
MPLCVAVGPGDRRGHLGAAVANERKAMASGKADLPQKHAQLDMPAMTEGVVFTPPLVRGRRRARPDVPCAGGRKAAGRETLQSPRTPR